MYLKYLREGLAKTGCDLHAYVLMSNHVHLLVTGRHEGSLSRLMQVLGRRYSRYVNRVYERTGALNEERFKSSLVESEAYFLECMRYIELNPVRARMVAHPGRYAWSSYRESVSGDPGGFLTPHTEYLRLGKDARTRGAAYRRLAEQPLKFACIESIRRASRRNEVLGTARFIEALEREMGRSVVVAPRGRPKRS